MAKTVLFHCATPMLTENGEFIIKENGKIKKSVPTHTLAFEKFGENGIILGWAKAHPNDNYCKSYGRIAANERIEQVKNRLENFPEREITVIDIIDESLLPKAIISNGFDYFFERAVSKLIELDSVETVTLYFRTSKEFNTVCSIDVDAKDIKENIEITIAEKIAYEKETVCFLEEITNYIFATYYHNNELQIVIQNRNNFYSDGLNLNSTEEIVNALDEELAEAGFELIIEGELIFIHPKLSELAVIKTLKSLGLNYDLNLESEFND